MPIVTFSGLASGIDGDSVIKATADARRTAILPLQNQLEENKNESNSLEEFNTKLLSLQDSLKDFLTLSGSAVAKKGISSNPDVLNAIVSNSALASSTAVTVNNLAKAATFSFNDRFTSATSPIASSLTTPGKIDITVGNGANSKTISVNVDSTTTLAELAESINNLSNETLRASVVNVGTETSPQYLLLVQGTDTGLEKGAINVNASQELVNGGLFQGFSLSQAEDAQVTIEGIGTINRPTNSISDVLPGVTLELKQASAVPILLNVSNDTEGTASKVQAFVDALNGLITFAGENNLIERVEDEKGVKNKFGPLARTYVDNRALSSIRSAISDANSGIEGSSVNILADLGITIQRDGTYSFDQDIFKKAAAKDPTSVNNLLNNFADSVGTTNGVIANYTKFQGQIALALSANDSQNKSLNEKIARMEANIAKESEMLKRTFANLERRIGRLNSEGQALSSMLLGLQNTSAR